MKSLIAVMFAGVCLLLAPFSATNSNAGGESKTGRETGLPVPRYVSLKRGGTNVRRGPGLEYTIDLFLAVAGTPLRIVDEQDRWAKIELATGQGGWVARSHLSGGRTVEVTWPLSPLYQSSNGHDEIAKIELGAQLSLNRCLSHRCQVEAQGHSGWVERIHIWGID